MIFITVGSQKFQFNRLLRKMDELVERKVITESVFAQIGYSDYKPLHYEYLEFLNQEDFNKKIEMSRLVVTHAGTGAIINSLKQNKKVIAIPRLSKYGEHVDDHQVQLVNEFKELNFIEPIYEIEELENAIQRVDKKTYNIYKSNTEIILKSIEEFIDK